MVVLLVSCTCLAGLARLCRVPCNSGALFTFVQERLANPVRIVGCKTDGGGGLKRENSDPDRLARFMPVMTRFMTTGSSPARYMHYSRNLSKS